MTPYLDPGDHQILCTSGGVTTQAQGSLTEWVIHLLDCASVSNTEVPAELTLNITTNVPFDPIVGEGLQVRLHVPYEPSYDYTEMAFTLRNESEGTLLLAGFNGGSPGDAGLDRLPDSGRFRTLRGRPTLGLASTARPCSCARCSRWRSD